MDDEGDDDRWESDEEAQQQQQERQGQALTAAGGSAHAAAAATAVERCSRCAEPLGDGVLEDHGFVACAACGFVLDDAVLVHAGPPLDEGRGGGEGGREQQPVGTRVWHDDQAGGGGAQARGRGGAGPGVGREVTYETGREARRRRLHGRLRAVMSALPVALPRRAAGDHAASLLDRVDAAYRPAVAAPGEEGGQGQADPDSSVRRAMRAETLAAVAYVTAREAGAPITFAGAAGAAACAPLAVAREFLRLKATLRLTVPQAPLGTLVLMQGATLLRIAGRGPPGRGGGGVGGTMGGSALAAATGGGPLAPPPSLLPPPLPPSLLPPPPLLQQQQQQQQQPQPPPLLPPPTRSAAGGLACSDRPSAMIAAASLAASNRDLARERARAPHPLASAPLARRVAAHPAVASALRLAELMQALGVAETRRHDAVAAACLKLCIGATPPKRGHAPLRRLSVAEVVGAVSGGVSAKAVGGAVRAAQAELRRMVPLLPFPVRFSDAGAHADLLLRLHRLACKAQPPLAPVAVQQQQQQQPQQQQQQVAV